MAEKVQKNDLNDVNIVEKNINNAVTQDTIPETEIQRQSNLQSSYTKGQDKPSEIASSKTVVAEEVEQSDSSDSQSGYLKWYLLGGLALGSGALALASSGRKSKSSGHNEVTDSQQTKDNVQSLPSQLDKTQTKPSQTDKTQVNNPTDSKDSLISSQPKDVLEKPHTEQSSDSKENVISSVEKEVLQKPLLIKSYQYDDSMFKNDTDKDGLFDALDPNPAMWNVSERDLRTFTTLSYQDEKELKAIFTDKNLKAWQEINLDEKSGLNKAFNEKESKDFIQNWELIEFQNTSDFLDSGLDYSVFGNGKKADGSYQQIVFAFRGSKGQIFNAQDYIADIRAMLGNLPTQAKELVEQTKSIVNKYNPDAVYATGHSLGGYLTQYFTAYVMQESPEFQAKMKHSAIFNPLLLLADKDSSPSLIKARENTDKFVKEVIPNDDVSNVNTLYKSNSYVINGEFLADGIPKADAAGLGALAGVALSLLGPFGWLAGALGGAAAGVVAGAAFTEYGTYENAVRFTPEEKGWFDGHKMIRFYEKTEDLEKHFSFGNRHDKWEQGENAYMKDSDKDGIADIVESYFHSDPNDANSRLAYSKLLINGEETDEVTPVVVYHLADKQDFVSTSQAKIEHIYGNNGDNRLDGGSGTNVLFGGKGKDIFVLGNNDFKHQELNIIGDFNAAEDKLDLRILDLKGDFGNLFSNDPNGNTPISWSKDTQTLNYQVDNQSFVLAQFLNQTELSVENFIV